jgi:signal transduction histidine kinase
LYPLLVVAAGALIAELLLVLVWRTAYGPVEIARELVVAAVWVTTAGAAWWLRPERSMGRLMLLFAILLALVGPVGLGVHDYGIFAAALTTCGIGLVPFQTPLGAHLLLAFPSGELQDENQRWLIRVAYAYAALEAVALLLTTPRRWDHCGAACAENLANVVEDLGAYVYVTRAAAVGWLLMAGWLVYLLARRYRFAGRRERRILTPPFAVMTVVVIVFTYLAAFGAVHGGNVIGAGPAPNLVGIVLLQLAIMALPVCFLIGLLRERLAYSGVSDLVRQLVSPWPEDRDLTSALARALGDPTLLVAFRHGDRLVDVHGNPVTPPARSLVTTIGEAERPLAVLIHEESLQNEPDLLVAASSALRLALDNARLHAELIAQLAEVRVSRARLVSAGDEARRKLERDLHDGAQQRLLAVGLAMQLVRLNLGNEHAGELLTEAELELSQALQELRSLAAGIHPAVLTDCGLRPAVAALADRCPVPLALAGDDPGRMPALIESTAYFCTAEAVTNSVKHASPTSIIVTLRRSTEQLVVVISDDGKGGADPTGGGLCGLADRVAALNGRLTVSSPPGAGTTITVELPCE